MKNLLSKIAKERSFFHPRTLDEFVAIQIASDLNDIPHLGPYLRLVPLYPHLVLADAAKRTLAESGTGEVYDRFFAELTRGGFQGNGRTPTIIGCKIERRSIALTTHQGTRLLHAEFRHLPTSAEVASRTVAKVLRSTIALHPQATLALEKYETPDSQRSLLTGVATAVIREAGMPLWDVRLTDLLGHTGFLRAEPEKNAVA